MHRFLKQSHTDILFAGSCFSRYILGILSVTKSGSNDVQQRLWTERWACCQPHLLALPAAMDSCHPSSRVKHKQGSFASENRVAVAMSRRSKKPFSFAQFIPVSVHSQIWSVLTSPGSSMALPQGLQDVSAPLDLRCPKLTWVPPLTAVDTKKWPTPWTAVIMGLPLVTPQDEACPDPLAPSSCHPA